MSKSNYFETALLNHMFGGAALSQPANYDIALYTTLPQEDGTGGVECAGGSYARKTVAANAFSVSGNGAQNTGEIAFVQASGDWGTVVGFGMFVGANLFYIGAITPNKVISTGDTAKFAAGDLDITED